MHSYSLQGWVGGSKSCSTLRRTSNLRYVPNYGLENDIMRSKLSMVPHMRYLGHIPADYAQPATTEHGHLFLLTWSSFPVNLV